MGSLVPEALGRGKQERLCLGGGPRPQPALPQPPGEGFSVLYIYGLKRTVSRAVFRLARRNSPLTDGVYGSLRHMRLWFLACQPTLALSRPSQGGRPFRVDG